MFQEKAIAAGSHVHFYIVRIDEENDARDALPDSVTCNLLFNNNEYIEIEADSEEDSHNSRTESPLVKKRYLFRMPDNASGDVIVRFPDISVTRFIVEAVAADVRPELSAQHSYRNLNSFSTLYQPYIGNISMYEPVYFLVGSNPEKSKFQISFKYRFLNSSLPLADDHPWLQGLHFGYTQTSFWDLSSESAPFADTSYRPELFWLSENLLELKAGMLKGVFLQTGIQHHSNGRDGEESRSSNYFYAQPTFIFFDENSRFGFEIAPRLWGYLDNDDSTNPDLPDYLGYFGIEAKAGFAHSFVFGGRLGFAREGLSCQLDISYPLHRFVNNSLDLYVYAQYVDMLAESLLDYNRRNRVFRLGLAIVR